MTKTELAAERARLTTYLKWAEALVAYYKERLREVDNGR